MNKLTIKIYSHLRYIKISYYLKLQIPIMHRHFFEQIFQNRDYVQTHCNDRILLFILHIVSGIYIYYATMVLFLGNGFVTPTSQKVTLMLKKNSNTNIINQTLDYELVDYF